MHSAAKCCAFAIAACFGLMCCLLNYANVIRAQLHAQNAADAMAQVILNTEASRWNKMLMSLYAADVEEWRIRSLIQAMIDASSGNGGCKIGDGSCLALYNDLQPQFYKAVNRYTADMEAVDSFSWYEIGNVEGSAYSWGLTAFLKSPTNGSATACSSDVASYCKDSFQLIDYSERPSDLTQQVGKDALTVQIGTNVVNGAATASVPNLVWQPARTEVSACETVNPIINFSIFGLKMAPVQVIARAAATMAPVTQEWLVPGVLIDPDTSAPFAPTETYSTADTFGSTGSPRDWYATSYPAQPYTADAGSLAYAITNATATPDFEVYTGLWSVVPIAPYTTAQQTVSNLCAGFYSN
jgi:hypothetical protein